MIIARAFAAAMAACLLAAGVASAQTYPSRPITLIVAFPPGGADDATAREAEAFLRAGDPVRAREAARHYQATHAGGRHARAMAKLLAER